MVDPVMVATSGAKLISEDAIDALKTYLLPMATVLTPNIPEAELLSGMKIEREEAMIEAAKLISENYHCAVLCKGGHQLNDANDLLYPVKCDCIESGEGLHVGDFCRAGERVHFRSACCDAESGSRERSDEPWLRSEECVYRGM